MNITTKKIFRDIAFVWQFAIDDLKAKYAGSFLGMLWAFFQPITTIIIYWFIFQLGFRSTPVNNFPFVLWLMVGLLPWFYFSDAITGATASLIEYGYLVKKVLFNIYILPIAKQIAIMLIQFVLIVLAVCMYIGFGYYPNVNYVKLPIYIIYMFVLSTGISYITSTIYVFFRDVMQIVSILLQVLFWMTPIVWDFNIFENNIQKALRFNPIFYIVNGYRSAFIPDAQIHIGPIITIYYWSIGFIILLIGIKLFKRCKDHFPDVI